jgi:tripartite-type tricarboxylate transporter receptor subunit TctC
VIRPEQIADALLSTRSDAVIAADRNGIKARIKTLGFDVIASTPEDFGAQMRQDVTRWGAVVEKAGIQKN